MISAEQQLKEASRGTVDFINAEEFLKKVEHSLKTKKPLRIKLGADPTTPDLHLGHTVVLQKLRQFQDLGHKVIFIIGDYTALIGDPSGVQKTRPQLSSTEIKKNAKTYFDQIRKILDIKKLEIHYNGEWFSKMSFADVIQLTSKMTVARMLERDDFSKRYKSGNPICLHEFIYPLMQGYDSLKVKADVEIGATDQIFNLLVGRMLQKEEGQEQQVILTLPLLIGTDGVKKMSKSYGNGIGISDPPSEMFGKIMSISDELMWHYYELLSRLSLEEINAKKQSAQEGKLNPKDAKVELAKELVSRFHSDKEAQKVSQEFNRVFHSKEIPSDIEEVKLKFSEREISLVHLLVISKCVDSNSKAKRMIEQGAVTVDGNKISDILVKFPTNGKILLKVGKRIFKRIVFK